MLKIKLARFGKQHQPHYRFVVNEARDKRDGKYVVSIGHYAPTQQPKLLQIDLDQYDAWLKKGAQPTDTVASLVEKFRSGKGFTKKKKLSKKALAKKNAPKEEVVAAEPVKEVPVEVTPEETAVTTEAPAVEVPAEAA